MDNLGVDGKIIIQLIKKKNNLEKLGLDSCGSGYRKRPGMSVSR